MQSGPAWSYDDAVCSLLLLHERAGLQVALISTSTQQLQTVAIPGMEAYTSQRGKDQRPLVLALKCCQAWAPAVPTLAVFTAIRSEPLEACRMHTRLHLLRASGEQLAVRDLADTMLPRDMTLAWAPDSAAVLAARAALHGLAPPPAGVFPHLQRTGVFTLADCSCCQFSLAHTSVVCWGPQAAGGERMLLAASTRLHGDWVLELHLERGTPARWQPAPVAVSFGSTKIIDVAVATESIVVCVQDLHGFMHGSLLVMQPGPVLCLSAVLQDTAIPRAMTCGFTPCGMHLLAIRDPAWPYLLSVFSAPDLRPVCDWPLAEQHAGYFRAHSARVNIHWNIEGDRLCLISVDCGLTVLCALPWL